MNVNHLVSKLLSTTSALVLAITLAVVQLNIADAMPNQPEEQDRFSSDTLRDNNTVESIATAASSRRNAVRSYPRGNHNASAR